MACKLRLLAKQDPEDHTRLLLLKWVPGVTEAAEFPAILLNSVKEAAPDTTSITLWEREPDGEGGHDWVRVTPEALHHALESDTCAETFEGSWSSGTRMLTLYASTATAQRPPTNPAPAAPTTPAAAAHTSSKRQQSLPKQARKDLHSMANIIMAQYTDGRYVGLKEKGYWLAAENAIVERLHSLHSVSMGSTAAALHK